MSIGVVLGSFSPLHIGHMSLIYKAKKSNDKVAVVVCGFKKDKGEKVGIPLSLRTKLVTETFKNDPDIKVFEMDDNKLGIAGYDDQWEIWMKNCIERINMLFNTSNVEAKNFYVSEKEYQKAIDEFRDKNVWAYYCDRTEIPISATMIRENPIKYWSYIAEPFRPYFQKKILVIGTASEGKTTLTKDLCTMFGLEGTYEFGHEAMEVRKESDEIPTDQHLTFNDFKDFLDVQYARNTEITKRPTPIRICDSDASTTMMYAVDYAIDERYDLTQEECSKLMNYAEENNMFINYDKIFVVPPQGKFVQDGTRDMLKSSIEERKNQYQILMNILQEHYNYDKFIYLREGYLKNFETAMKEILKMIE